MKNRIRQCTWDAESSWSKENSGKRTPDCVSLELAINCTQSINENCAKNAFLAKELTWRGPLEINEVEEQREDLTHLRGRKACFGQRFDEFFNHDGLCPFSAVLG